MKRCPTCQKTFDDNMRFCQTDGTPLIDDAPPADPYKTMVASKEDIQAALSGQPGTGPDSGGISALEEEPLEIPSAPPQATPASEFETKIAGRDVIEIPPLSEPTPPEPPKFSEPAAPPPSFGSESAPPSPFSAGTPPTPPTPAGNDFPTTPPIPSPFSGMSGSQPSTPSKPDYSEPEPEEPTYFEPEPEPTPSYSEPSPAQSTPFAEPTPAAPSFDQFEKQSAASSPPVQQQWTPPVPGGSAMSAPPPPARSGQKLNQTLPIVSLVFGIISLCCWISPLTGLIALITGFLGMKNVKSNPSQYGGKTLALVGMILGALFGLLGLAYWVFVIFFNGAALLMQLANQG